jgi:tryptophan synthase alpha chain
MHNIMTHLIYGYPTVSDSMQLLDTLIPHSRYVEIQIPFSDPIADGTIISDANTQALTQEIEMNTIFEIL